MGYDVRRISLLLTFAFEKLPSASCHSSATIIKVARGAEGGGGREEGGGGREEGGGRRGGGGVASPDKELESCGIRQPSPHPHPS